MMRYGTLIVALCFLSSHSIYAEDESMAASPPSPSPSSPIQSQARGSFVPPNLEKEIDFDELLKRRDPFKRPNVGLASLKPPTELEQFDLNTLVMKGVISGKGRQLKASLVGPNGKVYIVSLNEKIGPKGGRISRISTDAVFVTEKVTNLLGRIEDQVIEIPLAQETEPAVKN